MAYYVGERKVKVTFFTNKAKRETKTITHTFKVYKKSIDECREELTKIVQECMNLPYVITVTPISEHFEN